MHRTNIFAFLACVGLGAAVDDYLQCETSEGSPLASDCITALNGLDRDKCWDLNTLGSGCADIYSWGTCTITACTDDDPVLAAGVSGETLFNGGAAVAYACSGPDPDGKLGGLQHYEHKPKDGCGNEADDGSDNTFYLNVEFTHS